MSFFLRTFAVANEFTMEDNFAIQLFEGKKVRIVWDEEQEKYYFSVVDIVQVLTDSANATDYLKKLRKRDPELGSFLGTNCPQVEMYTFTGKRRITLYASMERDDNRRIQTPQRVDERELT